MKKLIAMALLGLSFNAFALFPTQVTFLYSYATTYGPIQKEAAQIINDSQEFIQSGSMSTFLSQKIVDVKAIDSSLSDQDALDFLISASEDSLK